MQGYKATKVLTIGDAQVYLDTYGFFATCAKCPYVSETTPSKFTARTWASNHDQDIKPDGRAN